MCQLVVPTDHVEELVGATSGGEVVHLADHPDAATLLHRLSYRHLEEGEHLVGAGALRLAEVVHEQWVERAVPPLGAVLLAKEMPPVGGDTMFANLHLAYDALSPALKAVVARLKLIHGSGQFKASKYQGMQGRATGAPPARYVHPLVREHPVTRRPLLAVSPVYGHCFEGMTPEQSQPLLNQLNEIAIRPEFCCRFRWQVGSMAVWDNRCLLHNALNDDFAARREGRGFRRVMQRATIAVARTGAETGAAREMADRIKQ